MNAKPNETIRPVLDQRFNHIRLVIWENTNKGQVWHNVVITRRFRDGDEWKESSSYSGLGDLALVDEAVDMAKEFLRGKALESSSTEQGSEVDGGN